MIGDPEPLTHEERLDFESEEARLEIEDRRRGEAPALAWLGLNGAPVVLERIRAEEFPHRLLSEIEPPVATNWTENGDFTRGFLATLKRVAGQHQLHEF
jgi:hypothetical protein